MRFLRRKRGEQEDDLQNLLSVAEKVFDEPFWKRPSRGSSFEAPPLDLSESEKDYLIELEAPGLDPDHLDLTVSDNTLTVKGEKRQEQDEEPREYHRIERRFGKFTRQVHLPDMSRQEDINAEYERGVLRITIPKSTESKTKQIDVTVKEG